MKKQGILWLVAALWLVSFQDVSADPAATVVPVEEENAWLWAKGSEFEWNVQASQYRFVAHEVTEYVLDRDGTEGPVSGFGEHRFRYSPYARFRDFQMKIELDVVAGQLYGDHEDLFPSARRLDRRDVNGGAGFDGFLVREAWLQYTAGIGMLKMGHMTSEYGLGMLANAGRDDDRRFGTRRYGDIVDRALYAATPFIPFVGKDHWLGPITLLLAGDRVFREENADVRDGDTALMGNIGLLYRHPDFTNGVIVTYRDQEDDDGDTLKVWAVNAHGMNRLILSTRDGHGGKKLPDMTVGLAYEASWLFGDTTRVQQVGSPEGIEIRSFGAVGRASFEAWTLGLEADLEVGYASGDNDPYDDESHAFYFDPDYKVGMVFFDEMLPLISARSAEISSDPANLAVPPKGLDMLPSQGRVTNSVYLFPQVRYEPPFLRNRGSLSHMRLMLGGLMLMTPARFGHSYYTFQNGGVAANHLGAETTSNYLGTELLAGIQGRLRLGNDRFTLLLRGEQSYFLPGKALEGPDGNRPDPVFKVMGTAALEFR